MNRIKSVNRVFLATVLISLLGNVINDLVSNFTDNYIVLLLISQIILIVPSLVYLSAHRINVGTAIRFHKIKLSNVALLVLFAYLILPLMNFINAVSMLFVKNEISDVMFNIMDNNGLLLSLIMVALVPCILEESVYRGIFYNEYSKVDPLKGMLVSGLLFGLMHGNVNQFSYAFAMGVVFALVIEATNSILATMIIHFVINGTSILTMNLYPKLAAFLERVYGKEQFDASSLVSALKEGASQNVDVSFLLLYGLWAIIPTILAFVIFRTIAKNTGRWEYVKGIFHRNTQEYPPKPAFPRDFDGIAGVNREDALKEPEEGRGRRIMTLSLAFGILICIVLMVVNEIYYNAVPQEGGTSMTIMHVWNYWF